MKDLHYPNEWDTYSKGIWQQIKKKQRHRKQRADSTSTRLKYRSTAHSGYPQRDKRENTSHFRYG